MIVMLLAEHHCEFLSLIGGCTGSYKSTHVKMPHCWKSHALAHLSLGVILQHVFKYINHSRGTNSIIQEHSYKYSMYNV